MVCGYHMFVSRKNVFSLTKWFKCGGHYTVSMGPARHSGAGRLHRTRHTITIIAQNARNKNRNAWEKKINTMGIGKYALCV